MDNQERQYQPERVKLKGVLAEFREALEDEIDKIKKSGQTSTVLYDGRKMESLSTDFWYRFGVEYAPSLPADTPCKLIIGKEQFDVIIISFEENTVILASKVALPETIGKARLENGATVLMELLIKCIEENADVKNVAGLRMLPNKGEIYSAKHIFSYDDLLVRNRNTTSQNDAITAALSNDITYVWGPPGTGKTTVIGQIIDELYKHNRSVLVVSHTNTAVDGAIEKAYAMTHSDGDKVCPILRMGTPTRALPDEVLLPRHIAALGEKLYENKSALEKRQRELQCKNNEILEFNAKKEWLNKSKLDVVKEKMGAIAKFKNNMRQIQLEMEEINVAIQNEKTANPEYKKHIDFLDDFEKKRTKYNDICKKVNEVENLINNSPLVIQNALDEIKKHDVHAELRARESKFMSSSFIRNELEKIRTQIKSLDFELADLMLKQTIAKQTIADYEKKSSVAKFFLGKVAITQAQTELESVNSRISTVSEVLSQQCELEKEYNYQLESLLLIQNQIMAVIPTETKKYWEKELKRLRAELADAQKIISSMISKKNLLHKELNNMEEQQMSAQKLIDTINEYESRLQNKREYLEEIKNTYNKENDVCTEFLKNECTFCAEFSYEATAKENDELFDELSALLIFVKHELSSVDMEDLKKEKEAIDNQLVDIFNQLNEIQQKMQEIEEQAVMDAKIVGATLAKSYLSETLRKRKFNTVILDEASMASIPALWCASYLAESSIIIVGDFLQLSPIVMAETPMAQKWLGKDIFYHSGMQKLAKNRKTCPNNFIMLNDQFRMESDIADVANMYYGAYGGLNSHDSTEFRVCEREKFYEWYSGKRTKMNIHLIDTENLHAWVTGVPQGKGHSRLNCFSAAVDVDLAFKFLEKKLDTLDPASAKAEKEASVLIVAPYKPHVARINQLIELEYRNRGFKENLNLIRAGTIHSFQGSEADIVIFDLVIDAPHWKANLFMTDKDVNEELRKMFNVAITRAKFKLFIVGNFAYCQNRAKNNALSELIDKLIRKKGLVKVDVKKILPNITFSKPGSFAFKGELDSKHIVCREESFNEYFITDVKTFKNRLIVYSPFMTEVRLSALLPFFVDAINVGKKIVVVTKALSERGKKELSQYQKCEAKLRDIGVTILHKKGMHEKLIFVDSEAMWIGSLNALSFTGLTGEVMQRHADRELTAEYEKIFEIEHLLGAVENSYEQKCPICGNEMLVKESDEGGIYWQCIDEDYSRNVIQQYPLDGILRCKCGAPYVFSMKNEPRWVCSKESRHYQKMRESDLKLEKMASMIPNGEIRNAVEIYFAQRRKKYEKAKNKSQSKM